MSRFFEALELLKPFKIPLFQKMEREKRAFPVAIGISDALCSVFTKEAEQERIKTALKLLVSSRRYLRALSKRGAQRHAIDGNPIGPVNLVQRRGASLRFLWECREKYKEELRAQAPQLLAPDLKAVIVDAALAGQITRQDAEGLIDEYGLRAE